jgi:hypothetical protein
VIHKRLALRDTFCLKFRRILAVDRTLSHAYGTSSLMMGVDGTGSGSCPVAGFGISGVEPSGSAASELVN